MEKVLLRVFVVLACLVVAAVALFAIVFRDKRTPIYFAAENGDTNQIGQYLASGGDVNRAILAYRFGGDNYVPLLSVAITGRQTNTVGLLLRSGANPNQADSRGETPLYKLMAQGEFGKPQERILEMLVKAGANPNMVCSGGGWTPLTAAAEFGETQMVRVLLAAGAHINATNTDGLTALHYAGNVDVARQLIAAGADPTAHAGGETPAESAQRLGHFSVLEVLTNTPARTNN